MTDGFDALLAGRGGLTYEQLDAAAERLQALVTDTAVAQRVDRLNGFVAEQVASVVAALNVAMQRAWLQGGHDS